MKQEKHVDDDTVRLLSWTSAHCVTCSSNTCTVVVTLLMCLVVGQWCLFNKGNLNHILHVQKQAVYDTITENGLDESETNLMNILFREEMKPSVIGRIVVSS